MKESDRMIKIALCDDNEIERGILKNVVEGLLIDIGYSAQVFELSLIHI